MKKIFWAIILVVLLVLGYQNRTALAYQAKHFGYYSVCDAPTKYKIGTIDNRFNITKDELLSSVEEANAIWSNAAGKQLFQYDPEGPLTISLQYDERQSLNSQINQLDSKLDEQNKELAPEIQQYEARVASFKAKAAALNQEIDSWNSKGGAPQDVYESLVARQKALQNESRELQTIAGQLGQSTQEYNSQVKELSQTVETYNQALQQKPEEGVYIQDQEGRRIIIYFYNTRTELVHTLAHELGHALGMNHYSDPNAIMFSRTNNAIVPTEADVKALNESCRRKSYFEITKEKFEILMSHYKNAAAK